MVPDAQSPSLDRPSPASPMPGAYSALMLLLAINLLNYIDRYVLAAVESRIGSDPHFHVSATATGWAMSVFLLSYTLVSPVFGWLADHVSRWMLIGAGVIIWSLASGGTGLAPTFTILLLTRACVGVGEAAYGPVAPTLLSDLFPIEIRGRILSWFYMAIPVGSALGFMIGGPIADHFGWRYAFYAVLPPGIILGLWALFRRDPGRGLAETVHSSRKATIRDYLILLKTRSYVFNTLAMAAMTFAMGGMSAFINRYIVDYRHYSDLTHVSSIFGIILVVAGFLATMAGGMAGDALRKRFDGAYFLVSAAGMLVGFPLFLMMLITPFPAAWIFVFLACFCLFFNTGPSNTALANVTHPGMRATAFAINIFVIHLLGDVSSPPLIGWISDRTHNMNIAFGIVSTMMGVGGLLWLWSARYLGEDTRLAPYWLSDEGVPVAGISEK